MYNTYHVVNFFSQHCALCNLTLDHVKHHPLDTTGTLTLDSVKDSYMVDVVEITTNF